jgi:hypothetical protein
VYACVPGKTPISEVMHEAAVSIGEKQQVDYEFGDINVENEHQELSGQTCMSISHLLNLIPKKAPCSLSAEHLAA